MSDWTHLYGSEEESPLGVGRRRRGNEPEKSSSSSAPIASPSRFPIKTRVFLFVIALITLPKNRMVDSFSCQYLASGGSAGATSWKVSSRQRLWLHQSGVGAGEKTDIVERGIINSWIRNRAVKENASSYSAMVSATIGHTPPAHETAVFSRGQCIDPGSLADRQKTVSRRTAAAAMIFGGSTAILAKPSLSRAIPQPRSEAASSSALLSSDRGTAAAIGDGGIVDLPLEYIPTLGAYVVRYFLFGEVFSAIVDTGSPFLTVPCYCRPYRNQKMFWGCYRPELTSDSGFGNTIEGFDNNYGTVVWRKAGFSFSQGTTDTETDPSSSSSNTSTDVVFGVLDQELLNGSGGVFFGLIKETDRWIRPSFLGQTGYKSFCVDLRRTKKINVNSGDTKDTDQPLDESLSSSPRLVLSKKSMIGTGNWRGCNALDERSIASEEFEDWIPLVRDLKKRYGAPVVHYTARASKFVVNGMPLLINQNKPLYVIFDTGVSGMVVSQELFDGRYLQARKNREKSLWGTVEVSFVTNSGREVSLSAQKPLTTPLGKATPWKGFRGNLIAVGLAFLDGLATTVDVDDGRILFV